MRSIREKRGLKNEDEEVIVDAIDADTDQSVEDELADIGVDLEEGEEEGDD